MSDDPRFFAVLYQWSARTSIIALEMVMPVLIGVGLDQLCGTVALFAILGVFLGVVLGFWQLLKIAHHSGTNEPPDTNGKDDHGVAQ